MVMEQKLSGIDDLIRGDQLDEAATAIAALETDRDDPAAVHYLRGHLHEGNGELQAACDDYDQSLEADPKFKPALFRMAWILDQRGHDDDAIGLYERCIAEPPVPVNAVTNLAVLYEDMGCYAQAQRLLYRLVNERPNHMRARLALVDVESAMEMYYDEDLDRKREHEDALLDMPISEFELSARSRNCLAQMDILTLGDLLSTGESTLLAYKNFGETSLTEIKNMLAQKGLSLGETVGDTPTASSPPSIVPALSGENQALLMRPVTELELSVRSRKCLQRLGISSIGELVARSEQELLGAKNFGQTSLQEIQRRLTEYSLSLRQSEAPSPLL